MSKPRRKHHAKSQQPSPSVPLEGPPEAHEPTGFEEHDTIANEPPQRPAPVGNGSHDFGAVDPSAPHVIAPRIS